MESSRAIAGEFCRPLALIENPELVVAWSGLSLNIKENLSEANKAAVWSK